MSDTESGSPPVESTKVDDDSHERDHSNGDDDRHNKDDSRKSDDGDRRDRRNSRDRGNDDNERKEDGPIRISTAAGGRNMDRK